MARFWSVFAVCCLVGCSGGGAPNLVGSGGGSVAPSGAVRHYNATAAVGDFFTIAIDPGRHTVDYTNHSNGQSGSASYTVNADGTYALNDPAGNLSAAYEIPGYALVLEAAKTGPSRNTPALVVAVESGPISLSVFDRVGYNYMQFRTSAGGFETGSIFMNSSAVGTQSAYWPYGSQNSQQGNSPFLNGSRPFTGLQLDSSGSYFRMNGDASGTYDYMFGTRSGIFVVDTPYGSGLAFQKAATKAFDPTFAGTYTALRYQKLNATTAPGNVETGTPVLSEATFALGADGTLVMRDRSGAVVDSGTLTPVADVPYLYGTAGELQDPCYGLFTYRSTTSTTQEDVFVTFVGRAMLFASYKSAVPVTGGTPYDYQYGVALK